MLQIVVGKSYRIIGNSFRCQEGTFHNFPLGTIVRVEHIDTEKEDCVCIGTVKNGKVRPQWVHVEHLEEVEQ